MMDWLTFSSRIETGSALENGKKKEIRRMSGDTLPRHSLLRTHQLFRIVLILVKQTGVEQE